MENVITVRDLSVSYGNVEALDNITLNVKKGEFLCVLGPNGGGKTTLLSAVLGFITKSVGAARIAKNETVSYVPQSAAVERQFPISVLDTVLSAHLKNGLHPFKRYSKEEKQSAQSALKQVGLSGFENRQIGELSGGEFRRLLLARAICSNPTVLLLDEPTANVDPAAREEIFKVLKGLNDSGVTIITVSHDLSAALNLCSRAVFINRHLLYDGAPDFAKIAPLLYGGAI